MLGYILLQRGETLAAKEHFQRVTKLDSPVPEAFLNRGTLLARADYRYHLTVALVRNGDESRAR